MSGMMEFGEFLRNKRQELGMTQANMASAFNMHPPRYRMLEKGGIERLSAKEWNNISMGLRVPLSVLLPMAGYRGWVEKN